MTTEIPQNPEMPIPEVESVFEAFPEPAGYALLWDGEALGQPPTGMNLYLPRPREEGHTHGQNVSGKNHRGPH